MSIAYLDIYLLSLILINGCFEVSFFVDDVSLTLLQSALSLSDCSNNRIVCSLCFPCEEYALICIRDSHQFFGNSLEILDVWRIVYFLLMLYNFLFKVIDLAKATLLCLS